MDRKAGRIALAAGAKLVSLASAQTAEVSVDAEKGVIRNVAVITAGVAYPCNAEPFVVDATMLQQVADAINAGPVKVRLTHPEVEGSDSVLWLVGTIGNARVLNGQVRADVQIEDYAAKSPNGDLRGYLLGIAQTNPSAMGMSIVFGGDSRVEEVDGQLVGRIASLHAVDFVGTPAANPAGLLSKKVAAPPGAPAAASSGQGTKDGGKMTYTAEQIAYLQSIGLSTNATADEIAAFVSSITPEQKAALDALAAPAASAAASGSSTPAGAPAASAVDANAIALAAANAANARATEINQIAVIANKGADWALAALSSGKTPAQLRAELATERAQSAAPVALGGPRITGGENLARVALRSAVADAVALKAGLKVAKPHELTGKFRSLRMTEIGRRVFLNLGLREADEWSNSQIAQMMLSSRALAGKLVALGAGDYYSAVGTFTGIFGDTANRGLLEGYTSFNRLWQKFARKYTAPDFKQLDRAAFGSLSLASTAAGYDVTYAALGDRREVYSLAKYTGGTAFTWEQIVNDDLDAISGVPKKFGFLAAQKEDSVAFGVITTNAAMADTYTLFQAANHANYTASGTAISPTSIGVGISQMMAQTDAGGSDALNIMPGVLMVSPAKLALARQAAYGQYDMSSNGSALNPWNGDLEVVSSGFLSGNAWYLFAKPGTPGESIEVAFLEGQEQPMVESEEDFDSKTMKMKVTHVVAAGAIDFRGAYKNAGA